MKRFCWSFLILALAIGCGQDNPPSTTSTPSPSNAATGESLPEGAMLVTLKLPEMT
ncbi:MAG: hypothetical protein ACKV2Q_11465 [Planctomycetaceae bacterium]